MGLLDGTSDINYYQGNSFGNYQFVSLDDIVNQFMIAYVGENKIIPKISKIDVSFYAQRALRELSFDTFKSIKAIQIECPDSLSMILPKDYVNYTRVMWADSSGIKHPMYPTRDTQNPFQILQNDDGSYSFPSGHELLQNPDFEEGSDVNFLGWNKVSSNAANMSTTYWAEIGTIAGKLTWTNRSWNGYGSANSPGVCVAYQEIDVSDQKYISLSADGTSEVLSYTATGNGGNGLSGTATGTVRVGISSNPPINMVEHVAITNTANYPPNTNTYTTAFDFSTDSGEPAYLEWTGAESSTKEIEYIDVVGVNTVWVWVVGWMDFDNYPGHGLTVPGNTVDNVSVTNTQAKTSIQQPRKNRFNSSTWNNYKAQTPSANSVDDYEDDTYWPLDGQRYGLDPQNAQVNGSFYVDNRLGKINFSSNISGKTVILDYISDSLGTDEEMQVHKFAEDAMYKWIAHAIISTSSYGQQLVPRFKKEKFAAVRQAKLRLSNIKLEELTQILRGKSKQIKH